MSGHFAGAERGADRRRRRLATQPFEAAPLADPHRSLPDAVASHDSPSRRFDLVEATCPKSPPPLFPLERIVPATVWPYFVAGLLATTLVAVMTWGAWPRTDAALTGTWDRLLAPPAGDLVVGVGTVTLGLAGQLAFLVGWGRARSQCDYAGQYRAWYRAGLGCWAFALISRLGLDHAWLDWSLSQHWPRFWNDQHLLVLLPTLATGAWLGVGLRREMSHCQASRTILMVVTTIYLGVVALKLGSWPGLEFGVRALVIQNALLLAHLGLALGFWIHARHVLYISCDPVGESRRTRWLSAPHWWLRGLFKTGGKSTNVSPERREGDEGSSPSVEAGVPLLPPNIEPIASITENRTVGAFLPSIEPMELTSVIPNSIPVLVGAGDSSSEPQATRKRPDGRETQRDDTVPEMNRVGNPEVGKRDADGYPQTEPNDETTPTKGLSKRERRRLQQEQRQKERPERG